MSSLMVDRLAPGESGSLFSARAVSYLPGPVGKAGLALGTGQPGTLAGRLVSVGDLASGRRLSGLDLLS